MIENLIFKTPDGVTAGLRRAGASGAALIFVHGVGSTASVWDPQLDAMCSDYRCVAVELRGNVVPQPEPQHSSLTRAGVAIDVLAAADACGIDHFTIVGCSLGGVVAFELWKMAPERIDGMVIADSFAHYPHGRKVADDIQVAAEEAGDMRAFAERRVAKLGLSPDRAALTIEQMAIKSLPSYLAATDATWTGDYRELLETIDVPMQVICGEHDTIAPLALSQEIDALVSTARLDVVLGAGHIANADAPDAFNALLREFLNDARAGDTF